MQAVIVPAVIIFGWAQTGQNSLSFFSFTCTWGQPANQFSANMMKMGLVYTAPRQPMHRPGHSWALLLQERRHMETQLQLAISKCTNCWYERQVPNLVLPTVALGLHYNSGAWIGFSLVSYPYDQIEL